MEQSLRSSKKKLFRALNVQGSMKAGNKSMAVTQTVCNKPFTQSVKVGSEVGIQVRFDVICEAMTKWFRVQLVSCITSRKLDSHPQGIMVKMKHKAQPRASPTEWSQLCRQHKCAENIRSASCSNNRIYRENLLGKGKKSSCIINTGNQKVQQYPKSPVAIRKISIKSKKFRSPISFVADPCLGPSGPPLLMWAYDVDSQKLNSVKMYHCFILLRKRRVNGIWVWETDSQGQRFI